MTSKFELRKNIDKFLEVLSLNHVDRFYPTALSKHLNITPSEALNLLLERSGDGDQLTLKWEARCPECSRTLNLTNEQDLSEYDCLCGEEVEITPNDLYPVFQINDDFKQYVKDELKKKRNQSDELQENSQLPTNLKGKEVDIGTLLRDGELSTTALRVLSNQPQNIINIININGGDYVDSKYIGRNIVDSFNHAKVNDNVAIQADGVTQTQINGNPELEKALSELGELIRNIPDELEKLQSETIFTSLEQSIEKEDKDKSGKFLEILSKTLGVVSPIITIAQTLGVPIPG